MAGAAAVEVHHVVVRHHRRGAVAEGGRAGGGGGGAGAGGGGGGRLGPDGGGVQLAEPEASGAPEAAVAAEAERGGRPQLHAGGVGGGWAGRAAAAGAGALRAPRTPRPLFNIVFAIHAEPRRLPPAPPRSAPCRADAAWQRRASPGNLSPAAPAKEGIKRERGTRHTVSLACSPPGTNSAAVESSVCFARASFRPPCRTFFIDSVGSHTKGAESRRRRRRRAHGLDAAPLARPGGESGRARILPEEELFVSGRGGGEGPRRSRAPPRLARGGQQEGGRPRRGSGPGMEPPAASEARQGRDEFSSSSPSFLLAPVSRPSRWKAAGQSPK